MDNIKPRQGLPENAKCVFEGVIFEVWQWEQEMFDGTKQTFEKIWRCPTIEIIATVGDQIIIEYQDQPNKKDFVSLPSGRADQSEDVMAEAKRELLEETGLTTEDWTLFLKHGGDRKVMHETYYYIARNCKKIAEPNLDAGEKIVTKLVSFDEFIALADEPRFWVSPEFITYLLRAKFDYNKKEELRKLIFGGS